MAETPEGRAVLHHALDIRRAREDEGPALVALINRAFVVERFFLDGERTDPAQIAERLRAGVFLVGDEPDGSGLAGAVYVEPRPGNRCYIGLLAVNPQRQKSGLGKRLMAAAEDFARQHGSLTTELTVVNLRTELFPFYESLGYRRIGEEPFPGPSFRPCHLVVMAKALASSQSSVPPRSR
jgi:GNAT superfamily N-acetyltransferase